MTVADSDPAEGSPPSCPNCGGRKVAAYCADCGQRQGEEVLSVRYWLREFADAWLSLDGRVLRSVRALLVRPGFLTLQWHRGRRAGYSRPLFLCLWAGIILVAMVLLVARADMAIQAGPREMGTDLAFRVVPLALLAAVPALAQVVNLIQWSDARSYVEHLVFATHLQAFLLLAMVPVIVQAEMEVLPPPWDVILYTAAMGYVAWYMVAAFRNVYGGGWPGATGKAALLGFVGYGIVVPVVTGLIMAALLLAAVGVSSLLGLAD